MTWPVSLPVVDSWALTPWWSTPRNSCGAREVMTAWMAASMLPSGEFLKPMTDEMPDTRSRAVWSVTLRAPTPLYVTSPLTYCGVSAFSGSAATGTPIAVMRHMSIRVATRPTPRLDVQQVVSNPRRDVQDLVGRTGEPLHRHHSSSTRRGRAPARSAARAPTPVRRPPGRLDRGREVRGHPPLAVAGLTSVAPDAGTRPGLLRYRCLLRRCADGPAWLSEPRPERGHREVRPHGSDRALDDVVGHGVRQADLPACGGQAREVAHVCADEYGLQHGGGISRQQVDQLGLRMKGLRVDRQDEVTYRVPTADLLACLHGRPDDVGRKEPPEVRTVEQRSQVLVHDGTSRLVAHRLLLRCRIRSRSGVQRSSGATQLVQIYRAPR